MVNEARRRAHIAQLGDYESGPGAPIRATETAMKQAQAAASVVLVEGISDQIAV